MTGARLLVETLRTYGVKTLFTLSGNQILSIYDACLNVTIDGVPAPTYRATPGGH